MLAHKRRIMRSLIALSSLFVLASCVAPAPPAPAPAPVPVPTSAPSAAPVRGDWRDWPATRGDWVVRQDARGSTALFGPSGADAEFTIRCDRGAGQVYLARRGAAAGGVTMTIRTTSTARGLAVRPTGATPAYLAAALGTRDGLLDAMGYSRGRFLVEVPSLPTLVLPAWAEVLRVVEDCR